MLTPGTEAPQSGRRRARASRPGGTPRSSSPWTGGRLPAWFAAVAPTARVAHPGLVAVTVGLAALPALLTLALSGDDLFLPLVLVGLVTGAALGWAVDDPAADLLGSMPIGSPVRSLVRIGAAGLVGGACVALLLVAVAMGPGLPPDAGDRWPEGAAAGGVALACGLVAARRGERAAGAGAVTAGVLGTASVAGMSAKFSQLPTFVSGPHHARWWLVALAALTMALHAGRDPARR